VSETNDGEVYTPNYFLTDHLGSTRAVVQMTEDGYEVLERNDYLPFGGRWEQPHQAITDNRHLFNGKELQTTGLPAAMGLLDYGWRMYDPTLARWSGVDQLAELYYGQSPYAFTGNNPVRFIDIDGREWYSYLKETRDEDGNRYFRRVYEWREGEAEDALGSMFGFRYEGLTTAVGDFYYSLSGGIYNVSENYFVTSNIMQADMSIMTYMNVSNWSFDFWAKSETLFRVANDQWGIINTFLDKSSSFGKKSMLGNKVTSWIFTGLDVIEMWQAYKDGTLSGWNIVDLSAGIIGNFGFYGAAASSTYTLTKIGASFMTKATIAIEQKIWRDFFSRLYPGGQSPIIPYQ
jgi:RHS repeat-associated protein